MSAPYGLSQCEVCEQYVNSLCYMAELCVECCSDCQEKGLEHD